jgi:hypothetical protein
MIKNLEISLQHLKGLLEAIFISIYLAVHPEVVNMETKTFENIKSNVEDII